MVVSEGLQQKPQALPHIGNRIMQGVRRVSICFRKYLSNLKLISLFIYFFPYVVHFSTCLCNCLSNKMVSLQLIGNWYHSYEPALRKLLTPLANHITLELYYFELFTKLIYGNVNKKQRGRMTAVIWFCYICLCIILIPDWK